MLVFVFSLTLRRTGYFHLQGEVTTICSYRPQGSTEAYAFIGYMASREANHKLGPFLGPVFFWREVLKHWKQLYQDWIVSCGLVFYSGVLCCFIICSTKLQTYLLPVWYCDARTIVFLKYVQWPWFITPTALLPGIDVSCSLVTSSWRWRQILQNVSKEHAAVTQERKQEYPQTATKAWWFVCNIVRLENI